MRTENMVARRGTTLDALSEIHNRRSAKNLRALLQEARRDGRDEEAQELENLLKRESQ